MIKLFLNYAFSAIIKLIERVAVEIKQIELKIQDNLTLRSSYMTYILALTSGVVGLFFVNLSIFTISLMILGIVFDVIFIQRAYDLSKNCYFLNSRIGKLKNEYNN